MLKIESKSILRDLRFKKEAYWKKVGERETFKLFWGAASRVPAYKDFLRKHKINPEKIKTLKDFEKVPPINKQNYLRVYPYKQLVWDGDIKHPITIHSTSGSTGEPTYFEREFKFDLRREVIIENFFRANKLTITEPTLFIITFGMGVWSAGMGIYTAAYLATNEYQLPISIISPGVNKGEVFNILRKLTPHFKQVIIAGYPPFIKDIIDDAPQEGINIKKFNMRFVFTGENFTEEFRRYILSKVKVKNPFTDMMNTYGTSELGAIAVETPLSILAMKFAHERQGVFRELFGDIHNVPTLAQYIPYFINFECVNGELFFTGDSTIPLVKYQSGDNGGIIPYSSIEKALENNKLSFAKEVKSAKISEHIYQLPLVFVYERKNLTTTLYGVLIFPEFIKVALFNKKLNKFLTGKFTMLRSYDKKQNQYLEINVELKRSCKVRKNYEKLVSRKVFEVLKEKSSEFKELSNDIKERAYPKIVFWPYESKEYFTPSAKQRWVKVI